METIGRLLESNLAPRKDSSKRINQTTLRSKRQSRPGPGLFNLRFDLDKQWQRLWEQQCEESRQLDQI